MFRVSVDSAVRHVTLILLTSLAIRLVQCDSAIYERMKETRQNAMRCPPGQPRRTGMVVALSPARYIQLIAFTRHDNEEVSCGQAPPWPFDLENPMTWSVCSVGICSQGACLCYQSFDGEKCERFSGNCYLMYCHLEGCDGGTVRLVCTCNEQLYGLDTSTSEYWYDDGLKYRYYSPPRGFPKTSPVESELLYLNSQGYYDVKDAGENKYLRQIMANLLGGPFGRAPSDNDQLRTNDASSPVLQGGFNPSAQQVANNRQTGQISVSGPLQLASSNVQFQPQGPIANGETSDFIPEQFEEGKGDDVTMEAEEKIPSTSTNRICLSYIIYIISAIIIYI